MTSIEHGAAASDAEPDFGVISGIDRVSAIVNDRIVAPLDIRAKRRIRVRDIMPLDWRFSHGISVPIDGESGIMVLDTSDFLPEIKDVDNGENFNTYAGVLRVFREIGGHAVDGYIVDYRRVTDPYFLNMGLDADADSEKFHARSAQYRSVFPLGILFSGDEGTHYVGKPELEKDALSLAQDVDRYVFDVLARYINGKNL